MDTAHARCCGAGLRRIGAGCGTDTGWRRIALSVHLLVKVTRFRCDTHTHTHTSLSLSLSLSLTHTHTHARTHTRTHRGRQAGRKTERKTMRLIRDREPRTATSTFTQLLSSDSEHIKEFSRCIVFLGAHVPLLSATMLPASEDQTGRTIWCLGVVEGATLRSGCQRNV